MLKSTLFTYVKTRKSVSGNEVVIPESLFNLLLRNALQSIPFDEEWYLENNPDVRTAMAASTVASAKEHFITQGYLDGRLPHPVSVDEEYYIEAYPDIRDAFERGDIKSLHQHFFETGRFEGRNPHANFSLFA